MTPKMIDAAWRSWVRETGVSNSQEREDITRVFEAIGAMQGLRYQHPDNYRRFFEALRISFEAANKARDSETGVPFVDEGNWWANPARV